MSAPPLTTFDPGTGFQVQSFLYDATRDNGQGQSEYTWTPPPGVDKID